MISSSGGAAQRWGGFLGQYEYDVDKGYYVQTSTKARYLYRDEDDEWLVGFTPIPGKERGYLRNLRSSKTPPSSGWQYIIDDEWQDDQTLTVTPSPLTLPSKFTGTDDFQSGDSMLFQLLW